MANPDVSHIRMAMNVYSLLSLAMATVRLPPDVLHLIFNHFITNEQSDRQTLEACSLVCQEWTMPAQAPLFAVLVVRPAIAPIYFRDLPDRLTGPRMVGVHVRHLIVDGMGQARVNVALFVFEVDIGGAQARYRW